MSRLAQLRHQDAQFIREAKEQGAFVGFVVGFTGGIIFASAVMLVFTLIGR